MATGTVKAAATFLDVQVSDLYQSVSVKLYDVRVCAHPLFTFSATEPACVSGMNAFFTPGTNMQHNMHRTVLYLGVNASKTC